MDWIRLGNSGADLTGVGGVPRVVTLSELASHNKQNDAWIAIRGTLRLFFFYFTHVDTLIDFFGIKKFKKKEKSKLKLERTDDRSK